MTDIGQEETFWSLIQKYQIQIPIIQRDYVQARKNEKVIEARNKLLADMKMSLDDIVHKISLNFIFGKVDNSHIFIPIDGQQRLTTLFILHWYAFLRDNDFQSMKILSRFSYETRISSKDFIEKLVEQAPSLVISSTMLLSDLIKDETWFQVEWKYDPTVDSILVMIDEIQKSFGLVENLSEKLKSSDAISFQFLNMSSLGLKDGLYIKLNARGRQLTKFENFKSELSVLIDNYVKENLISSSFSIEFKKNLDGEWAEFFWNLAGEDKTQYDLLYMRFIDRLLWNHWASKNPSDRVQKSVDNSFNSKDSLYRMNEYKEHNIIDIDILKHIYLILNKMIDQKNKLNYLQNGSSSLTFIKAFVQKESVTYEERIRAYAITCFISVMQTKAGKQEFEEWERIIFNLSHNTSYDNSGDYVRSILSVKSLSVYCADIMQYFVSASSNISGFSMEQIEEEKLKALLICINNGQSSQWRELILNTECHPYLAGQIGFLLDFSGVTLENIGLLSFDEMQQIFEHAKIYAKKFSAIFSKTGLVVNNSLWRRSLLCKGDYLLSLNSCWSLLVDNNRDIGWKTLLRKSHSDNREYIKELLDDLDNDILDKMSIEKKLSEIIANFGDKSDWRYYFIKYDDVINECGSYQLIYISPETDRILLVPNKTTSGYNLEYYTWVIFLELKKKGLKPVYYWSRGRYGEPEIREVNDKTVSVKFLPSGDPVKNPDNWKIKITGSDGVVKDKPSVESAVRYIEGIVSAKLDK